MLKDNIKTIRKSKGLSQEELAVKLNVVRQTISKWEQGLSVPDADMLIEIAEVFETPVSVLLGENVTEQETDEIKKISEKLEVINLQLAKQKEARRNTWHWIFIVLCALTVLVFVIFAAIGSPYLAWDFSDPETAVLGTAMHMFEWTFIRIAPLVFIGSIIGAILTRKRK